MVHERELTLDVNGRAAVKQLGVLLHQLSMPFYSSWVAYICNRFQGIVVNRWYGHFNVMEMHQGLIKHSCTSTVLTEGEPGVFNEARFQEMIAASADGERMTSSDFLRYHKKLKSEPGSTFAGGLLNRLEFSILLIFLGDIDGLGSKFMTIDSLRNLYQNARLPHHTKAKFERHAKAVISGRVIRQESNKEQYLAGLNVQLWHNPMIGRSTLLATTETKGDEGTFSFQVVLPTKGLPLQVRFIDPRPSMERDRAFYEIACPGRVSGHLNLGLLRVPHWQYDSSFPFPVARKNDHTGRVPQRFRFLMSWRFGLSKIWLGSKLLLVSILSALLSLKALHHIFRPVRSQRQLQEKDSDSYFMYRVLNGFYPSPVYLTPESDSEFPESKYFLDCNFNGYESDGSHNLITGQLYFDINDYESEPIPRSIHLQIRATFATDPASVPETKKVVPCDGSPEWALAKRAFRSAWAAAGELDAHLSAGHLNVGQYALAAYRNFFASPIAQLLLPVLGGVTEINERGKGAIFGVSGVLSTNTPLTAGAMWARLGNHLGTLDWYDWKPPHALYAGHAYPLAANLFWGVVKQLVEEFFEQHEEAISEHRDEIEQFSFDIVENCVPFFQANQFQLANEASKSAGRTRPSGLSTRQLSYQKYEGLGNFKSSEEDEEEGDHPVAIHKIQPEDMKQCCQYIIFHATFFHWWSNDLQSTDLSNIFYTSLGLRGGALGTEEKVLPPVREAVGQLSFAKLLTGVKVGKLSDKKQGSVMNRFAELLNEKRSDFEALRNPFERDQTFNVDNIRSRTNI
ncbi:MAG: hypothetical protein ACJAYE_001651 [Candidatus Azotimanducaceae bacterium]|jgi:hypothetical protein